uniref:Uncharacterized protein n=1 Tax=Lotharella globosa TaxID=91324 RepID=A0A6V3R3R8_9EUKA|mmetsp:Transcript_5313/g.10126  ORF Transcript_5313/g.10126 Transcript_5313/m.10126 type:complete len:231 (+) Transcript_5313:33-725(+)
MGGSSSLPSHLRAFKTLQGRRGPKILVLGLPGVGKTKLLEAMKLGDIESFSPFEGFMCEVVKGDRATIVSWSCQGDLRLTWPKKCRKAGVVFVCDSTDRKGISKARISLQKFFDANHTCSGQPLLVLASKQDVDGAMTCAEVTKALQLDLMRTRRFKCVGTELQDSVIDSPELEDGLSWLSRQLGLSEDYFRKKKSQSSSAFRRVFSSQRRSIQEKKETGRMTTRARSAP